MMPVNVLDSSKDGHGILSRGSYRDCFMDPTKVLT